MDSNKKNILSLIILLLIFTAVQIGGFFLLWAKTTDRPEYVHVSNNHNESIPTEGNNASHITAIRILDENTFRETVRSILKQELSTYLDQLAIASEKSQKIIASQSQYIVENSTTNVQAWNESTNIVDGSLAQGVWTKENSMALIQYADQLTPSQRIKIMEKIAGAVNRQELKIEDFPPAL